MVAEHRILGARDRPACLDPPSHRSKTRCEKIYIYETPGRSMSTTRRWKTVELENEALNPFLRDRQLEDQRDLVAKNRNPRATCLTAADMTRSRQFEMPKQDHQKFYCWSQSMQGPNTGTTMAPNVQPEMYLGAEHPSLAPYQIQVDTAERSQASLNFNTGIHRPWSQPRLHLNRKLDFRHSQVVSGGFSLTTSALRHLLDASCKPQVTGHSCAKLRRPDCACVNLLAPWADHGGRYQASHQPVAIHTFTETLINPKRCGPVKNRPGWNQSFCTRNVINHAAYKQTVSVHPMVNAARKSDDMVVNSTARRFLLRDQDDTQ